MAERFSAAILYLLAAIAALSFMAGVFYVA
jgi:hypothetical protein